MNCYLDSNIVIYLVESHPQWGLLAEQRIGSLLAAGDKLVVSDLTRLECKVDPLRKGADLLAQDFDQFFSMPELMVASLTSEVMDRAIDILVQFRFKPLDAIHLAASIESGCGLYLTNDHRLSKFPDVPIEILS